MDAQGFQQQQQIYLLGYDSLQLGYRVVFVKYVKRTIW